MATNLNDKTVARYGTALRCYDKPATLDRYTIIPPRTARAYREGGGLWQAISASAAPYHPQGIGQFTQAAPGSHLGRRVHWHDLPLDVRRLAREAFPDIAPEPAQLLGRHVRVTRGHRLAPTGSTGVLVEPPEVIRRGPYAGIETDKAGDYWMRPDKPVILVADFRACIGGKDCFELID